MAKPPNIQGVGVPWFTAETWERLLEVSADADLMPGTYAEWKVLATRHFADHAASGAPLQRVLIDPDKLAAWCGANNLPVDARGRSAFAAVVLKRRALAH